MYRLRTNPKPSFCELLGCNMNSNNKSIDGLIVIAIVILPAIVLVIKTVRVRVIIRVTVIVTESVPLRGNLAFWHCLRFLNL